MPSLIANSYVFLDFYLVFSTFDFVYRNETESRKAGKGSFAYAWVLDETEEERTRYCCFMPSLHCKSMTKFSPESMNCLVAKIKWCLKPFENNLCLGPVTVAFLTFT